MQTLRGAQDTFHSRCYLRRDTKRRHSPSVSLSLFLPPCFSLSVFFFLSLYIYIIYIIYMYACAWLHYFACFSVDGSPEHMSARCPNKRHDCSQPNRSKQCPSYERGRTLVGICNIYAPPTQPGNLNVPVTLLPINCCFCCCCCCLVRLNAMSLGVHR